MEVRDAHVLLGRQKPEMFPSPRLAVSGDDVSVPRCSLQPLVLTGVCVDLLLNEWVSAHGARCKYQRAQQNRA